MEVATCNNKQGAKTIGRNYSGKNVVKISFTLIPAVFRGLELLNF